MRIKFRNILLLLSVAIVYVVADDFKEEIFIKPLPPTNLYVYFQFITQNEETSCMNLIKYLSYLDTCIKFFSK